MRSALPVLLALSLAAGAFAADPECAPGEGRSWQDGKLVKVRVEERSESGAEAYGQVLRLTLTSGGRTWLAQCAVGRADCDPEGLAGGTSVRFQIEGESPGQTLILKRPDGRLLCARVAPPA